ncbi:hypothetical protein V2H45_14140 [Tumidithrix elongata RA019]|uniref:Uncharacterized protein n=1 Tax=Tumidithrix elongata BACA0141 TaxID=2716417 RepID=A0AAW9PTA9_9CYAN|nr:hypothetical protein [Tumidithrix elongata RA019]
MKKLILGCLPVLFLSTAAVVLPAKAEVTTVGMAAIAQTQSQPSVSPFNLAYLAYQGYFEDRGISSYATLIEDVRSRKVTPTQLVQAAVDSQRLAPSVLNDSSYISAVESQLTSLVMNQ